MRRFVVVAAMLAALVYTGTALAAGWTELGTASANIGEQASVGPYTVSAPQYFSVDLVGKSPVGSGAVKCTDSAGHTATTITNYSGVGYHALNLPYANPVSCTVEYATVFSLASSSTIVLWVYA